MTHKNASEQGGPHPGGHTTSLWHDTIELPRYPKLTASGSTDVCVIGAGIAGLSVAYHLARDGKKVVVLDDGPIGGGESGRTTAHLTNAMDDRFYTLESLHGELGARLAAESHGAAINRVQQIIQLEDIDCDFERLDGYLMSPAPGVTSELEREAEAAQRAGLTDVSLVSRAPIAAYESGTALRFPGQAMFHPLEYLAGLARAIVEKYHGTVHCDTHVEGVEGGDPCIVKVAGGVQLSASRVVVCTNASISDYVQTHAKMEPHRTYAIAAAIPRGSAEKALYWDTGKPYHYVRVQRLDERQRPSSEPTAEQQRPSSEPTAEQQRPSSEPTAGSRQPISDNQGQAGSATPDKGKIHWDALIVGGEDRKTGHDSSPEERWDALEKWMRERWPEAREVIYRWSGQVLEPSDGLAYIGRNPDGAENVFMASGDSGQGMTHGTIAGILLADIIAGRANPWETLYDPKRVSLGASSLKEMALHNVDVAAQYAKGVLKPDVKSLDDIAPGEGAIVRRGTKKVAVYKTPEGRVVEKSALCTHLKCVVRWNGMEKSWDCPCHGSRFTPTGEVLNGPAIMALEDVEPEAASKGSSRRTARKAKA